MSPHGEAGEVDSGLVSPAPAPLPASTPFRAAPAHEHLEVGGSLRHFLPSWKEELEVYRGGCLPALLVLTTPFVPDGSLLDPFAGLPLRQSDDIEVATLLEKRAIEEVPLRPPSLGFVSCLFLVQKKNGKMRSASTSVS